MKRIVLTGGPGAGKTAVLELIRHTACKHVHVLPETAGMLFSGGFPRSARRPAQRAIYFVQRELEATVSEASAVICDRGTVDGAAYWPGPDDFFAEIGSSLAAELARYDAVIHLRTPPATNGYNHQNPLRLETPEEAMAIDQRIAAVWAKHENRIEIPPTADFITKASAALTAIDGLIPPCCARARMKESAAHLRPTAPGSGT